MGIKINIKKSINEIIGTVLTLFILIPFYLLLINSFKDKAGAAVMDLKLPEKWNIIANYSLLIKEGGIPRAFMNSVLISCISVTGIVILSAMTAFIIQRRKSGMCQFINSTVLAGMFLPTSMVPTYFIVKNLHLNAGYLGISLVYIAASFPVAVFLFTGFYKSIPIEIDESASLDGCGITRLFFNIIFPLIKPVTVTVLIISFMGVWNDFGISIYFLNSPKKYTMVLTTFNYFGTHAADWNLVFADIVVISLPVMVLYFALQKYIVSGMTAGAVKG